MSLFSFTLTGKWKKCRKFKIMTLREKREKSKSEIPTEAQTKPYFFHFHFLYHPTFLWFLELYLLICLWIMNQTNLKSPWLNLLISLLRYTCKDRNNKRRLKERVEWQSGINASEVSVLLTIGQVTLNQPINPLLILHIINLSIRKIVESWFIPITHQLIKLTRSHF